jgi:hypothetical protein
MLTRKNKKSGRVGSLKFHCTVKYSWSMPNIKQWKFLLVIHNYLHVNEQKLFIFVLQLKLETQIATKVILSVKNDIYGPLINSDN